MPTLPEIQAALRDFVFAGATGAETLIHGDGLTPEARLSIHRNTTFVTLTDALAGVYPVTRRLVGDDFFVATARTYLTDKPPMVRCLIDAGADFADFLDGFDPAAALPYLGDVARLEWAWHSAFHAADAVPIDATALRAVGADEAPGLRLFLHPSARLVSSRYPVHRIWQVNQGEAASVEPVRLDEGAAHLLVVRPRLAVEVLPLEAAAHDFVASLSGGATLETACAAGVERHAAFDPGPVLASLLSADAVTGFLSGALETNNTNTKEISA